VRRIDGDPLAMSALDHFLLGVAAVSVWGASLRLASAIAGSGLVRILIAMTFAATIIVVETMVLAIPRLGGSQIPLVLAAVTTWLAVAHYLPRTGPRISDELSEWAGRAPKVVILGVSAAIGVGALWAAWALWSPVVGVDGVYYHLPQIVRWIHDGAPGSVDFINYIYPVGNYPLTNAVAQAWGMGISRSMVAVSLWPIFSLTVLILAGWVGLRRLAASSALRVLALLAVATTPVVLIQLAGPFNDLPALSWVACGAALVVCSKDEPRLLIPSVAAVGLAIGTKTIALPLGVVILIAGVFLHRRALRPMAASLGIAFGVFAVVGCFWYARNLFEHGSPFWPWASAPWGDPVPQFLDENYSSLLSSPRETLAGRLDLYASFMGGALVLLLAAGGFAISTKDRILRWMGVFLAGLLLLWAATPSTARAEIFDGSVSQTRYLLPAIGLAAASIALAGRQGRKFDVLALGALSIALIWNLAQLFTGEFPASPPEPTILLGALAGVAFGAFIGISLPGRVRFPKPPISAAAGAISATLLAVPAASWVSNHGDHRANFDAGLAKYLSARQDFRDGNEPIWMTPLLAGPLAGDHLQHDLRLIPPRMPCPEVASLRSDGWVIIRQEQAWVDAIGYTAGECLKEESPLAVIDDFRIYKPR
jgi:hypothetical protein